MRHNMRNIITPLLLLSFAFATSTIVLAEDEKPLSETIKEEKKFIEQKRQKAEKEMKAAKILEDKDTIIIWENMDVVLENKSKCFKENEELTIRLCLSKILRKLADEGNFVAQNNLAKSYEGLANDEMALKWYNTVIKNPKTPLKYKYAVLDDIEKLEDKLKGKESKQEKPLSESIKEEIKEVSELKESLGKQKRKATLLEDKEMLSSIKELEEAVDSQTKCFEKQEELDITICMKEQIKNLADKGNYLAQHMLGNLYENGYNNKPMAIQWYKKALENPKTPKSYHYQLQNDLERAQGSEKKEE